MRSLEVVNLSGNPCGRELVKLISRVAATTVGSDTVLLVHRDDEKFLAGPHSLTSNVISNALYYK